ncbi:hypothetical protein AYI68_g7215 [Smittium mucronatum]|uniref:Uncharacterized protein n=1 Tax=Smittium mucronatum TaxID=133383 RepID=A0A1R0GPA6_9FUNG|nr:hypothetical protein AYI68_g7215 [Smittium mucronatum]
MESVVTRPPSNRAFARTALVRLALYTQIHDMVFAYCAIIHRHVPRPQRYRIPFLDFKAWNSLFILIVDFHLFI